MKWRLFKAKYETLLWEVCGVTGDQTREFKHTQAVIKEWQ